MKKLFSLLLAFLLLLPMGACAEEGGETMANFLYNGVERPDINEVWPDKETYPYAYISDEYYLIFSKQPAYWKTSGSGVYLVCDEQIQYHYGSEVKKWLLYDYGDVVVAARRDGEETITLTWANTDTDNPDGTLYVATSTPIKVPSSLTVSVVAPAEGALIYNGKILGEPPASWDKTAYPYAYITSSSFVVCDKAKRWDTSVGKYGDGEESINYCYWGSLGTHWIAYGINPSEGTYLAFGRPTWSNFDIYDQNGELICAESEPVKDGLVTEFDCSSLDTTDSVYKVAAWCYPKGTSYLDAPHTYTSAVSFPGSNHSEKWVLTGLPGGAEYELYACILVNDVPSDRNALVTFTVPEEEGKPFLLLTANQITGNGFTLFITTQNLEADTPYTAEVIVYEPDSSRVVFEDELTIEGSSGIDFIGVTGLEPETEYAVSVDIYPDGGEVILHGDHTVTTTAEVPVVVRDSFPLGFASGLCGVPITEAGGDYNTWAQGYIAGEALRKALGKE